MREEKQSIPLSSSEDSFPPAITLSIDDRGAFFENLVELLQLNNIEKVKRLHDIEHLDLSTNECMYVNDLSQNKLLFNKGFYDFLGYDEEEITIDLIRQLYHPDDIEITSRVFQSAILYTLNHPKDSSNNTLFISFRVKRKNGTYVKVLSRSTILDMDENGRIISSLVKFINISFIDKTDNVNWDFKANHLDKEVFKKLIYKPFHQIFTNREIEIIAEIDNELSNKQIAENLNISEHTVTTHRKRIFKKAACHSSKELILFCKGIGVL